MVELNTFLSQHTPFDALGPDELLGLAAGATEQTFEAGETVLVEDGPPVPGLWVILEGSMELVHEGEPVQVLEPGECFGQTSLLTGMSPAFTVRAREETRCARLDAPAAHRVLGTKAGIAYVATSMRKRLTYTGHTVHGLPDVGTTPVSAIMSRPSFCEPDEPLRDAAGRLGRDEVSALLVRLDDSGRLGILTDAVVRAAVAVDGVSLDAPVRSVARTPVPTVPARQLAIEATIEMLASDSEHLAVLDGDRICGLLSAGQGRGAARQPARSRRAGADRADRAARGAAGRAAGAEDHLIPAHPTGPVI